jgi:hypothetical protein
LIDTDPQLATFNNLENLLEGTMEGFGCGGVDLNHRPLGYEPRAVRNFNNLQDAGGYLKAL